MDHILIRADIHRHRLHAFLPGQVDRERFVGIAVAVQVAGIRGEARPTAMVNPGRAGGQAEVAVIVVCRLVHVRRIGIVSPAIAAVGGSADEERIDGGTGAVVLTVVEDEGGVADEVVRAGGGSSE